ncbi:unnamed protein product [Rotaria magnacalcarata]|uniref:MULE transposase domain-containing protein n=1 Tax=Rotaria magnacalcarata TaxID=392030 RepID=A0A820KI89_9BILA|nr:unnamed protein product [Rotaria magnacalcarata]CAF4343115.1 unnamed protein product [Rotaria magnacalcarata]
MVDFETASIKAIRNSLPISNIHRCFFHLCQNVYRAVIRFDLKTLYSENEEFAQKNRSLLSLAFLTTNAVIPTFDEIKAQFPMESEPVLKYCKENYISIGTGSSRSRKLPKFDISLLNVNNNIMQGKHRANTVIEGCNNTFSSLMGCSSLNFWKFIKGLKKEQSFVDAQVIQTDTDTRQARKRDQIRRETHILNLLNVQTTTNYMKKFWL